MTDELRDHIDRLMLGEITGRDLPHPLIGVYLLGLFEGQRDLACAEAEIRRLDAISANPFPRDVVRLEQPTFAELSSIRRDSNLTAAALRRARTNQEFGRGVA